MATGLEVRIETSNIKLTAITMGHLMNDFYVNVLPAIIPFLVLRLHLSEGQLGLAVTIMHVTSSFLQPYFGYLIDANPRGKLLPLSLLWIAVTMSLLGLATNLYWIIVLATLASLGSTLYHPLGSVLTAAAAPHKVGTALSIYSTGGNLGFALAPILVVPLVMRCGLPGLLLLIIPGIVCTLFLYRGGIDQMRGVTKAKSRGFWGSLGEEKKWLLVLNLIFGIMAWVQIVINTFVPLHYVQMGSNEVMASLLQTVYLMAGTGGILAGGYAADKYRRKPLVVVSFILSGLFFLAFFQSSGLFAWVMLALGGFTSRFSFPLSVLLAQELIPDNAGMAAGMMMGLSGGLGSIGSYATGMIAEWKGLLFALHTIFPLFVIMVVLGIIFPMDSGSVNK